MSNNYQPGDLVWVKDSSQRPAPEVPGAVEKVLLTSCYTCGQTVYGVVVPDGKWACCTSLLRPRRDDYQQHEGLGCLDGIKTLVLTEQEMREHAEEPA